MTYWNSVWQRAVRAAEQGYYSHSEADRASFRRCLRKPGLRVVGSFKRFYR